MSKTYLLQNVYDASQERLKFIYDNFDNVIIAFSGGKDSTLAMWLTINAIPDKHIYIYFWDKESNHLCTRDYILSVFDELSTRSNITLYWFCLPYHMRNALSIYEPWWTCWDDTCKDKWIYQPPERDYIIRDGSFLEGYDPLKHNLYKLVANKIGENGKYKNAIVVGLRADESLNRYRAVTKNGQFGKGWITKTDAMNSYNVYPIYDWDFADIWKYFTDNGIKYNSIYDKMFAKGIFKREMRISQSFCDVSKKTMPLYREIEPESFERFLQRVKGVNSLTYLDLDTIKSKADEISYDFIIQSFPEEIRESIEKRAKIKDKKTVRALLNGDIRLKRVGREKQHVDLKEKYADL
jgi:predicted phosphoadenosine phosphosulfate sulfurtransferase